MMHWGKYKNLLHLSQKESIMEWVFVYIIIVAMGFVLHRINNLSPETYELADDIFVIIYTVKDNISKQEKSEILDSLQTVVSIDRMWGSNGKKYQSSVYRLQKLTAEIVMVSMQRAFQKDGDVGEI